MAFEIDPDPSTRRAAHSRPAVSRIHASRRDRRPGSCCGSGSRGCARSCRPGRARSSRSVMTVTAASAVVGPLEAQAQQVHADQAGLLLVRQLREDRLVADDDAVGVRAHLGAPDPVGLAQQDRVRALDLRDGDVRASDLFPGAMLGPRDVHDLVGLIGLPVAVLGEDHRPVGGGLREGHEGVAHRPMMRARTGRVPRMAEGPKPLPVSQGASQGWFRDESPARGDGDDPLCRAYVTATPREHERSRVHTRLAWVLALPPAPRSAHRPTGRAQSVPHPSRGMERATVKRTIAALLSCAALVTASVGTPPPTAQPT